MTKDYLEVTFSQTSVEDRKSTRLNSSHVSESRMPFFDDTATTEIYTLSLHDALPIYYCNDVKSRV